MEFGKYRFAFLALSTILLTRSTIGGENNPKIFTKDGSVHIRSGDNGNIVFEHASAGGKVIVAGNELNVFNSTGPKGDKGEKGSLGAVNGSLGIPGDKGEPGNRGDKGERGAPGRPGTNGTTGTRGTKGEPGPPGSPGASGRNGSDGDFGLKGDRGDRGPIGVKGETGHRGLPGLNGTVGEKGTNGTQGIPGVKGEKGDNGYTSYYTGNGSINCNSSNFGILRYFSRKVQLCTPHGWRYLSFEQPTGCDTYPDLVNVPEANYQTFRDSNLGIMFEFNRNIIPKVISQENLNISADISPVNSTIPYQDAVMRQAAFLSGGKSRINISGISDDFWRKSNWSVMALLKFRDIGQKFVRVLGHGTTVGNQGLHLGIVNGAKKTVINGYYSNDFQFGTVEENTWYHITWTSEKNRQGADTRCIYVNGISEHKCEPNVKGDYQGSGITTVGAWWHEKFDDNLLLDNLIIASGVIQYNKGSVGEKQLCFARTLDENLP